MPTLNWIGKKAVETHHREMPFRLLEAAPELSCDAGGGNLLALKALLRRYAGQVKCVYIDPPYNTGNEGWAPRNDAPSIVIARAEGPWQTNPIAPKPKCQAEWQGKTAYNPRPIRGALQDRRSMRAAVSGSESSTALT
jgi:hypothetical protein